MWDLKIIDAISRGNEHSQSGVGSADAAGKGTDGVAADIGLGGLDRRRVECCVGRRGLRLGLAEDGPGDGRQAHAGQQQFSADTRLEYARDHDPLDSRLVQYIAVARAATEVMNGDEVRLAS